ncbi:MAG TPA: tetratricopeptide repeat protein, partial [Spirochaetes bacterium]|nr:tetratricopeptide repeat protein [Spirochaetota bacterium]
MKFPRIKTILAALLLVLWTGTALTARTNLQPLYEQGLEAFKAGNFGSAELMFRKIVEAGNDGEVRDGAWYHLALSIFNQKKYKDAIFEFNRFLLICTLQQLCLESRYWIAESYFYLKDYIRAIQEYKRFIAQSKDEILKVASFDRIGEIYFIQSRYDEAIIEWREAINLSGNIAQNNARVVKIGEALYLNESYDESLNLLESLLRSKIDREAAARARMIIGAVYQLKNRHRDALKALSGIPEQLLKQAPFYDAQYFKALSSMELGDNYSAKSLLESFLLIGKESEWYYNAKYQLGAILLKEGREKDGLALLEEVRSSTRKMSLRSKAALILGNLYLKKDPREAIPYLEDAVSLDEPAEQKNAMLLLSRVYIEVERYDDAERLLQLLISAYPGDRENDQVQFLISQVYLYRGEVEMALEGFEKIREINPGSPYIKESNYFRALAYEKMGRTKQALEALNAYIAIPGVENRYEALVRMAGLYVKSDDIVSAEKRMNQIVAGYLWRNGVENVLFEYGITLREKDNTNYSRYFNLVLNRFPKSEAAGEVLLLWGDDYFEKKNYAQSERMYRMYLTVGGRKNAGSVFLYRVISLYHLQRYRDLVTTAGGTDLSEMSGYTKKQVDLWKARAHYRLKSYDLAYGTFAKYPLRDYEPPDLMIIMRSSLEVGDVSMAQTVNGMLAESDNYRPEARFVMGQYYAGINQPEVAEEYYRDLLSNDAGSAFADQARL